MSSSDRMARQLQTAGRAFEAVELLKAKLESAIQKLTAGSAAARATGRLSTDEQAAVRILRSRQRQLDREWLVQYGSGKAKQTAQAEMAMTRPDDGTLIMVGERMHAVGRLSCRACATTMNGLPFPVPSCRVCTTCNHGVQHAADVPETVPGSPVTNQRATIVPAAGNTTGKVVLSRHYTCDACGATDTEVIG